MGFWRSGSQSVLLAHYLVCEEQISSWSQYSLRKYLIVILKIWCQLKYSFCNSILSSSREKKLKNEIWHNSSFLIKGTYLYVHQSSAAQICFCFPTASCVVWVWAGLLRTVAGTGLICTVRQVSVQQHKPGVMPALRLPAIPRADYEGMLVLSRNDYTSTKIIG